MLFEEAAGLRDRILALEKYARKQKVVSEDEADRDLFAMEMDERENVACGVIFQVRRREGHRRRHTYIHPIEGLPGSVLMQRLVEDYYADAVFFPGEVLLSVEIAEPEPVKELLAQQRGRNVPLAVPRRGPKASLMRMVSTNAAMLLEEWKIRKMKRGEDRIPHAVRSLEEDLRLETLPAASNASIFRTFPAQARWLPVWFFATDAPEKANTATTRSVPPFPDNPTTIRACARSSRAGTPTGRHRLARPCGHRWRQGTAFGGCRCAPGNRVYGRFPLIGLAKRLEEVFFPGDSAPLHIPKASTSLQLLQRIRNEAHRFAVTFQRTQRKKRTLHTSLREIDGVGEKTAQKLIRRFGSVKRVEAAGEEALREAVGTATARKITAFFDAKRGDATSQRSA